jgi:HEAT repeat protein
MRVLASGTFQEVWEMLEGDEGPDFDAIGDPEDDTVEECRASLLTFLTRAVSRTDDIRVPTRVLEEIEFDYAPPLEPVLRMALAHGSADVRRAAARAAEDAIDQELAPAIEAQLEVEADPRVRRALVRALGSSGSRSSLPLLRRIAESEERLARHAAIEALCVIPDAGSVTILESFALAVPDGKLDLGGRITTALASWSDVPTALDALVTIGRTGPRLVAAQAMAALSSAGSGHPEALDAIASARAASGDQELADWARKLIEAVQTRPEIRNSQDRGHIPWATRGLPLAGWDISDDALRPPSFVAPSNGLATARCWEAPGFLSGNEIQDRLPAGTSITIIDDFEWGDESWLASIAPPRQCWLRESDVSETAPPATRAAAIELDVAPVDAESWAARTLEQRGSLQRLDDGPDVIGIRIEPASVDRETVAELVQVRRYADSSVIALALGRWLFEHAQEFAGDGDLGDGVPSEDPRWAKTNVARVNDEVERPDPSEP